MQSYRVYLEIIDEVSLFAKVLSKKTYNKT